MSGGGSRSLAHQLLVGVGSSWARVVVMFAVSLVLTPALIGLMGLDLFGVFMLVSVSLAVAGPLRGAVRKTLTRELTGAVSSGDDKRIEKVFSNGVCLGALAGGVMLLLTAIFAFGAPAVLKVSDEHKLMLGVAVALEGLLLVEIFFTMAWHNLFFATKRIIEENAHRAINRVLDLIAVGVTFLFPLEQAFYAFIFTRFGLHTTHHVVKCLRARALVPAARFDASTVSAAEMRDMARVGGWSTANQIARLCFYQADQILLNLFFGPVYNGLYAIVNQLRSWARMIGGNISFGIDALAADLHERDQKESSRKMLIAVMKITASVTAFFSITAAVCAEPLVNLWLGERLTQDESLLELMTGQEALALIGAFVLIITPSTVIAETHTAAAHIFYGMGLIRTYSIPMIVAAIGKIGLATGLLAATGSPLGVVWATLVAQAVLYVAVFGWIIVARCGVPLSRLAFEVYGRGMLAALPCAAAGWWYVDRLSPLTIPTLIGAVVVMGAVHGVCFVTLCLSREERGRLLKLGGGALGRIGRKLGRTA